MYLPGVSLLVLYFAFMLALLLAVAGKTPLPPALLAAILGGYLTYAKRYEILEVLYGERCLLLVQVSGVKVKKDYILFNLKKKIILNAFLKVENIDYPESDTKLGEIASRFISFLYLPTTTVNIISTSFKGQRSYYLKINFVFRKHPSQSDMMSVSRILQELQRRLLSLGIRTTPADPREVLPTVAEVGKVEFRFAAPIATIASLLLALVSFVANPHLLPLAFILVPLTPLELSVSRGGETWLKPKRLVSMAYVVNEVPDAAGAASIIRSFSGTLAWSDDVLVALLVPEDQAAFSARVRKAMEVLEAGRAGVGRLKDEFKSLNVISMYRALEAGAKPFRVATFVGGEAWRFEPLGLERELSLPALAKGGSVVKLAKAMIGLPSGDSSVKISSQIAWLTPFAFIRPKTRRTRKAIYLGRGIRKEEEVWLELDLLENVHGLIVGPMGSGKSTTARTLALRALDKSIVPIFVDPSGEYRAFAQRMGIEVIDIWDRPFNPLFVNPSDLERALSYVAPLSEYEAHLLRSHLKAGARTLVEIVEKSSGTSLAWKLEKLQPYFEKEAVKISDLLAASKPFVLCMGSTASGNYLAMPIEVQRAAFELLLAQMRDFMVAEGLNEPKWLLIVDEGHLFMLPPPGYMEPLVVTMARMLRKFGLAVVMLTHEWGDVPESFRRAAGWKIALSHSDPDYVSMTRVYMALSPLELTWFQAGVKGRAVLRRGHEPYNILVEIDPIEEARTDRLHDNMKSDSTHRTEKVS